MLQLLDYLGIAVFAATGALAASRLRLDFIATLFFASVTGLGGGTLRDVLLGTTVFWIANSAYLVVPAVVGAATYFTAHWWHSRYRALLWADAIGLAAYSVMGAGKALALGTPPLAAIVMGIMTATFGGVLRDVLAGEPSVMLKREIYVTAALVGAAVFTLLAEIGIAFWFAAIFATFCAFALRAGALWRGWAWPQPQGPAKLD